MYSNVYLIGFDGAGNFFKDTDTPNIDRIFENGAFSHHVLTEIPTISAQCWGSMLMGVDCEAHGLTNSIVGLRHLPDDFAIPTVFKLVREKFPDANLAAFSCWNPINYGIIEEGLNIHKDTGEDDELCEKICEFLRENDTKLLFVQFDSVDGAGRRFGYGTKGHLDQITHVDALLGKIFDTIKDSGRLDDALFIVNSDHGGTHTGGHGGDTDAEKIVSFFVRGKGIKASEFTCEIKDTAALIASAFDIDLPTVWTAKVPDIFE